MTRSVTAQIEAFIVLFRKWNASINLSAARTVEDLREHIEDCLHVVPLLESFSRVIDVGSGGGLPVVIAALSLPEVSFVALEPVHKKHAFLRTAARELGLANLEAFARRIEDHDVHDYDAATSRATFDLAEWLERGRTLVRPGGVVIGFEAIERSEITGPEITRHEYTVAGKRRALVVAR